MRKLLSIIALSCAMALAFGAYAPGARAAALSNSVLTLKADQPTIVQQARYRCWWQYGYRRCGYVHGWRHRYWRHRYWHHYGWRHRYWRHHYWHREHRYWRYGYYHRNYLYNSYAADTSDDDSNTYAYRPYHHRHYYYNSYARPTYRYARPGGYCIGLCWW